MQDISKYTKNAQKYIRYDWAACEVGRNGSDEEFRRILNERDKFLDENFTLEDYDSMLEDSKNYTPAYNMWKRAKEQYIAEHHQNEIKKVKKEGTKSQTKRLRKAA